MVDADAGKKDFGVVGTVKHIVRVYEKHAVVATEHNGLASAVGAQRGGIDGVGHVASEIDLAQLAGTVRIAEYAVGGGEPEIAVGIQHHVADTFARHHSGKRTCIGNRFRVVVETADAARGAQPEATVAGVVDHGVNHVGDTLDVAASSCGGIKVEKSGMAGHPDCAIVSEAEAGDFG